MCTNVFVRDPRFSSITNASLVCGLHPQLQTLPQKMRSDGVRDLLFCTVHVWIWECPTEILTEFGYQCKSGVTARAWAATTACCLIGWFHKLFTLCFCGQSRGTDSLRTVALAPDGHKHVRLFPLHGQALLLCRQTPALCGRLPYQTEELHS